MEAGRPLKLVGVFPEPTPYRAPLLDLVAARPDVDLVVAYSAQTVASRTWRVEFQHRAVFLRGRAVPGVRRILRHDYPVTPSILRVLRRERPDCVLVSGWSTFASQASILWCIARRVPYLVVVESHDRDPRSGWRRAVKWTVVPRLLRRSAGALVTGTLARESMLRAGVPADRIWLFANTVDTRAFAARAEALRPERARIREGLGVAHEQLLALSVSRLVPEKALDILLGAAARVPAATVVLAGDGPERAALEALGTRAVFLGDVAWERIVELYAAADVFVLLSRHEPWGVVVNEAVACGLPLVLSEHVGAAADLLEPDVNGILVPVNDVAATAAALERLAGDAELRERFGRRSSELSRSWDYATSLAGLSAALDRAIEGTR